MELRKAFQPMLQVSKLFQRSLSWLFTNGLAPFPSTNGLAPLPPLTAQRERAGSSSSCTKRVQMLMLRARWPCRMPLSFICAAENLSIVRGHNVGHWHVVESRASNTEKGMPDDLQWSLRDRRISQPECPDRPGSLTFTQQYCDQVREPRVHRTKFDFSFW